MKIQDHLRKRINRVHKDDTFRDVLKTMIEQKTNGLVVVDDDDHPIGTIDSFHLIQEATPPYLRDNPNLATFAAEDSFHTRVSESLAKPVSEMMQPFDEAHCVHPEDPIVLAATLASKHGIRYIPVIDDDGKLIGLVTRTDIKRAMATLLDIHDDPNA